MCIVYVRTRVKAYENRWKWFEIFRAMQSGKTLRAPSISIHNVSIQFIYWSIYKCHDCGRSWNDELNKLNMVLARAGAKWIEWQMKSAVWIEIEKTTAIPAIRYGMSYKNSIEIFDQITCTTHI